MSPTPPARLLPSCRWLNQRKSAGLFMRVGVLLAYQPALAALLQDVPTSWLVHLPSGTLFTPEEWEAAQPWEVTWRSRSRSLTAQFCQQQGIAALPPCSACRCCQASEAAATARLIAAGLHRVGRALRSLREWARMCSKRSLMPLGFVCISDAGQGSAFRHVQPHQHGLAQLGTLASPAQRLFLLNAPFQRPCSSQV